MTATGDELTRCITLAREIVDEAIPLDPGEYADSDSTELRKIAFGMVLRELLDYES